MFTGIERNTEKACDSILADVRAYLTQGCCENIDCVTAAVDDAVRTLITNLDVQWVGWGFVEGKLGIMMMKPKDPINHQRSIRSNLNTAS